MFPSAPVSHRHWFFFLHQRLIAAFHPNVCLFAFFFYLKLGTVRKKPSWRIMLAVRMCEWKANKNSAAEVCCSSCWPNYEDLVQTEKVDFLLLTFSFVCVFGCVYLQVVGLDTDQRPLSRGGPAGEGQGSQPWGPEGPEGRLGSTEGLGRKLPGECEAWQRGWGVEFSNMCLYMFERRKLNTATQKRRNYDIS